MDITIKINCDNAAFVDDFRGEVRRILDKLADKLTYCSVPHMNTGKILDSNGNTVGTWEATQ